MDSKKPVVLTIAGSDSGGGAGIQADLKTFEALGCFGTSAITAITAQNTKGVIAVASVDANIVTQQIEAVLRDMNVRAVKVGMLYSADVVRAVAAVNFGSIPVIYDPVMVSTSGHSLMAAETKNALVDLLAKCTLLTPNIKEAEEISGESINSSDDLEKAASRLLSLSVPSVLIKGGHLDGKDVVDSLFTGNGKTAVSFKHDRLETTTTHGTGCTLSAAIAAYMALGNDLEAACQFALHYVWGCMEYGLDYIGEGSNRPLNHSWCNAPMVVQPVTTFEKYPFTKHILTAADQIWEDYVNHPACQEIAKGTLPIEGFTTYLCEDYKYLGHYARLHALVCYKDAESPLAQIQYQSAVLQNIATEMDNHVAMCEKFGIARETVTNWKESVTCTAYTRYMLDVATTGSVLEAHVAAFSCLYGYGVMGKKMVDMAKSLGTLEGNRYKPWLDVYTSEHFWEAIENGQRMIEDHVAKEQVGIHELERLKAIFVRTTEYEIEFFNLALTKK